MFSFAHWGQSVILMNNLRVQYCNINFLLQIYVKKRLHKQFKIVNFITLCIIYQKIILLCLFLNTYHLLTNRTKFCGIMSNPAESIKNCFTIIAFPSNIIRNCFWNKIIETLLVNLYSFIKFLKIKVSTVPKII